MSARIFREAVVASVRAYNLQHLDRWPRNKPKPWDLWDLLTGHERV